MFSCRLNSNHLWVVQRLSLPFLKTLNQWETARRLCCQMTCDKFFSLYMSYGASLLSPHVLTFTVLERNIQGMTSDFMLLCLLQLPPPSLQETWKPGWWVSLVGADVYELFCNRAILGIWFSLTSNERQLTALNTFLFDLKCMRLTGKTKDLSFVENSKITGI